MPELPLPPSSESSKRRIIHFSKPIEEIAMLADYFEDPEMSPSDVGKNAFETVLATVEE